MSQDNGSEVRSVTAALAGFDQPWQPRRLARVNDYDVKVAKFAGEFVWHSHPNTDELFLVIEGRDRDPAPRR